MNPCYGIKMLRVQSPRNLAVFGRAKLSRCTRVKARVAIIEESRAWRQNIEYKDTAVRLLAGPMMVAGGNLATWNILSTVSSEYCQQVPRTTILPIDAANVICGVIGCNFMSAVALSTVNIAIISLLWEGSVSQVQWHIRWLERRLATPKWCDDCDCDLFFFHQGRNPHKNLNINKLRHNTSDQMFQKQIEFFNTSVILERVDQSKIRFVIPDPLGDFVAEYVAENESQELWNNVRIVYITEYFITFIYKGKSIQQRLTRRNMTNDQIVHQIKEIREECSERPTNLLYIGLVGISLINIALIADWMMRKK